jgi:hypothetical protein
LQLHHPRQFVDSTLNSVINSREGGKDQIAHTVPFQTGSRIKSKIECTVESFNLFVAARAQGDQALAYIAEWWVTEFLTEDPGASTAIEHGDNYGQIHVVRFKTTQCNGGTTSSANYHDAFAIINQADKPSLAKQVTTSASDCHNPAMDA